MPSGKLPSKCAGGKSVRILAYDQHEHRQGLEFLLHPGKLPSEYAGAKSAHILVYDRREQRVVEETISPYMVLAMRNMYQTPVGRLMMGSGAHRALLDLTRREGRYMNSPASIKVCLSVWLSFESETCCYVCHARISMSVCRSALIICTVCPTVCLCVSQ